MKQEVYFSTVSQLNPIHITHFLNTKINILFPQQPLQKGAF